MGRTDYGQGDYRVVAERLRPAAEVLVEWCAPEPGTFVLDLAAGTGNVALAARRRGCRALALDLEIEQLVVLRSDDAGVPVVCADASRLPLVADAVDHVLSTFGVIYAPDHRAAVLQAGRTCRTGGFVGVTAWPDDGFQTRARDVLASLDPTVGESAGGVVDRAWRSEERITETLAPVGEVEVRRGRLETLHADADEWWAITSAKAPPIVAARSRLGADGFEELGARLRSLVLECSDEVDDGSLLVEEYLMARARVA